MTSAAQATVGTYWRRVRAEGLETGALLAAQAALSLFIAVALTIIWAAVGSEHFWPRWIYFGVGVPLGFHLAITLGFHAPRGPMRTLAVHASVSVAAAITIVVIWAMNAHHAFWPQWPLIGLVMAFFAHALVLAVWHRFTPEDEALAQRVSELTRTRRGALDVQAAELRRIERDLHDGAQSRLVALSVHLGRAEERLRDRPEEAALVREARNEASLAIGELRDLARGIAPPVLADRGLAAAVEALGKRAAMPVTVDSRLDNRPPPVIEDAAYFVVSESLANVAKHAGRDATASVWIEGREDRLVVDISDDGSGGVDAGGSGILGLRQRVEALDGWLAVGPSPSGGTTVHAELPCEW